MFGSGRFVGKRIGMVIKPVKDISELEIGDKFFSYVPWKSEHDKFWSILSKDIGMYEFMVIRTDTHHKEVVHAGRISCVGFCLPTEAFEGLELLKIMKEE